MSIYRTLQQREFSVGYPSQNILHTTMREDETAHGMSGFPYLVKRLQLSATLDCHRGCVNTVKWNERGTRIVSGSDDTALGIWEITNSLDGPPVGVPDIGVNARLTGCLSQAGQNHNCKLISRFPTVHSLNIFGAQFVPTTNDDELVSCALDNLVAYSVLSKQISSPIARHERAAHKFVIVDPHVFITCGEDGYCKLIDMRDADTINKTQYAHNARNNILEVRHFGSSGRETLYSIDLNPINPNFFAITTRTKWTRVYDLRTLSIQSPITQPMLKMTLPELLEDTDPFSDARQGATGCKWSCDGRELAVNYSGRKVALFDITKPEDESKWFETTPPMELLTSTLVFDDDECFLDEFLDESKSEEVIDIDRNEDEEDMDVNHDHDDDEKERVEEENDDDQNENDPSSESNDERVKERVSRIFRGVVNRVSRGRSSGNLETPLLSQDGSSSETRSRNRFPAVIRFRNKTSLYSPDFSAATNRAGQAFRGFADRLSRRIKSSPFLHKFSRPSEIPYYTECREFSGHYSVRTVKEVNFFGPRSEYIISGSDCSHAFIWDKKTGKVVNVIEGDRRITNVVQGHPSACILATSGLDSTVKIWTPTANEPCDPSSFESILQDNTSDRRPDPDFIFGGQELHQFLLELHRRGVDIRELLRGRYDSDSDDDDDAPVERDTYVHLIADDDVDVLDFETVGDGDQSESSRSHSDGDAMDEDDDLKSDGPEDMSQDAPVVDGDDDADVTDPSRNE